MSSHRRPFSFTFSEFPVSTFRTYYLFPYMFIYVSMLSNFSARHNSGVADDTLHEHEQAIAIITITHMQYNANNRQFSVELFSFRSKNRLRVHIRVASLRQF